MIDSDIRPTRENREAAPPKKIIAPEGGAFAGRFFFSQPPGGQNGRSVGAIFLPLASYFCLEDLRGRLANSRLQVHRNLRSASSIPTRSFFPVRLFFVFILRGLVHNLKLCPLLQ